MKIFNFTFLFCIFVNLFFYSHAGAQIAQIDCLNICGEDNAECILGCNVRNKDAEIRAANSSRQAVQVKKSNNPTARTTASRTSNSNNSNNTPAKTTTNADSQSSQEDGDKAYCTLNGGDWDKGRCITADEKRMLKCFRENKSWDEDSKSCKTSNEVQASEKAEAESLACIQEFNRYKDLCVAEASNAMTSCNDENESMKTATNAAKAIGAGSVVSLQMACSKLAEVAKLANGAFGVWNSVCATKQGGCQDNCGAAKRILESDCMHPAPKEVLIETYLSTIRSNITQCESYKIKIQEAAQHAAAALGQMKSAERCVDDTSSNLQANNLDQCKTNPNSPLCADMQKCSNPTFAAQNPVCTCVANPTSPSCFQAAAAYQAGGLSSGSNIPGTKKSNEVAGLNGLDPNAILNSLDSSSQLAGLSGNPSGGDGQSVGGRQGDASSAGRANSGGGGGGGIGGGNYGGGGSGGAEKDSHRVNSGTIGGMPMGTGYFGKTNMDSGGSYGQIPNSGRRDLAKFDPRKYITGQGGKGEYINGANENIFKIVKMRYEDKKTTLLPENFTLKK